MLSIVVYGRNDSHGYNLHKRAALSLNAIAEQLTASDDEIIFVDYNTPDEIPTFPEAISDTLTEKSKSVLRTIRVRPEFHRNLNIETRLVALEPHARNIGFRRANPNNRWVLSTNTDMIFAPRETGSMSQLIAGLEDGFYHLPRFELPEGFWERLDRKQPREAIDKLREWGTRFHLNEIVYGDFDNLYEAPGDFQLFLRDDLDRIDGFDETMILGWHVDSNVARRMKILRGEVGTLTDRLLGYHCGHTRQATLYHSHVRTENSIDKYCRNVSAHNLPFQHDCWGAPGEIFEEVRLGRGHETSYFKALESAILRPAERFYEGRFPVAGDYIFRDEYDSVHVLPYLCDLISSEAPQSRIAFFGSDPTLADGLASFWKELGRGQKPLLPSDWSRPQGLPEESFVQLPLDELLSSADMFIVQFPEAALSPQNLKCDEQWRCAEVLHLIAARERERAPGCRRRLILVNSIGNPLEQVVENLMSYTLMPFGCRLRHGYVIDEPVDTPANSLSPLLQRLHRRSPLPVSDMALIRRAATALGGSGGEKTRLDGLALEVAALGDDHDTEVSTEALARAKEIIANASARAAEPPVEVGPRAAVSTRLCSSLDWEDPEWRRVLARCFWGPPYELPRRTRWTWMRISIMAELERQVPRETRPWVLYVGEQPDVLPALAAARGYRAAYTTRAELLGSGGPADWTDHLRQGQGFVHSDLMPLERATQPAGDQAFAAVIFAEGSLYTADPQNLRSMLELTGAMAAPHCLLLSSITVHLNDREYAGALPFREWKSLFDEAGLLGELGFSPAGSLDPSIPVDTLVRFGVDDTDDGAAPALSFGMGDALATVGLISARWPNNDGNAKPARIGFNAEDRTPPNPEHRRDHARSRADVRYLSAPDLERLTRPSPVPIIDPSPLARGRARIAWLNTATEDLGKHGDGLVPDRARAIRSDDGRPFSPQPGAPDVRTATSTASRRSTAELLRIKILMGYARNALPFLMSQARRSRDGDKVVFETQVAPVTITLGGELSGQRLVRLTIVCEGKPTLKRATLFTDGVQVQGEIQISPSQTEIDFPADGIEGSADIELLFDDNQVVLTQAKVSASN